MLNHIVKDIIETSKAIYNRKLVTGLSGNISCRVKENNKEIIAITPTSQSLKNLKEEDIVLIDEYGNCLTKGKPSSEANMHLNIYKERDDVNAIVHTHSPYATGFAFSYEKLRRYEGFGPIKTNFLKECEYKQPGSEELALKVVECLEDDDIIILKKHGVVTVGKNLEDATLLAEYVEDIAHSQFVTNVLNMSKKRR